MRAGHISSETNGRGAVRTNSPHHQSGAVLTLGEAGIDLKVNFASGDMPLMGEWAI